MYRTCMCHVVDFNRGYILSPNIPWGSWARCFTSPKYISTLIYTLSVDAHCMYKYSSKIQPESVFNKHEVCRLWMVLTNFGCSNMWLGNNQRLQSCSESALTILEKVLVPLGVPDKNNFQTQISPKSLNFN
jgi:hypothetical protein